MAVGTGAGPTSLNYVHRKNEINKINVENNAFLQKLQGIRPAVPDTKKLEKVQENVRDRTSLS